MPEGPEVKRTVDKLKKFQNKILTQVIINSGRYLKKMFKKQEEFMSDLPLKIMEINCKGKFIYWKFDNNKVLFNTLGMSGTWTTSKKEKHNNLTFIINNKELYFNDYRNFGTLMYQTEKELENKLKSLGVDIIQDFKNYNLFRKNIERKRNDALIGITLLDQKIVSGCGNYLRAEVLYHSKISPYREIKNLKEKEIENLWEKLTKIAWIFYDINKGITSKVFTKSDYLVKLYYQKNYQTYGYYTNFYIYDKEKDKLGNKVLKEKLGSRTIHWVKNV